MSSTYYLYKPYKKERFDLGSLPWKQLFLPKKELDGCNFTVTVDDNVDGFFMWMLSEMAIYFPETTTLKELRILAEKIVTWCKNDKVSCWEINDFINEYSTGKPILEEYPVTGTFYEKRP